MSSAEPQKKIDVSNRQRRMHTHSRKKDKYTTIWIIATTVNVYTL